MWIPWSDEDAARVENVLRANGGFDREADQIRAELNFRQTSDAKELGNKVYDVYAQLGEDQLSVDNKVAISETDDGAHILCWLWLSNEQLGVETHQVLDTGLGPLPGQATDVVYAGTEEQCETYLDDHNSLLYEGLPGERPRYVIREIEDAEPLMQRPDAP